MSYNSVIRSDDPNVVALLNENIDHVQGTLDYMKIDNILSDESVSFTKTFEYSGGDYKAFVWDALGTMTPLAESVEYKK